MKLRSLPIASLKPHEKVEEILLQQLLLDLQYRSIEMPIVVDRYSLTVIDGHHRLESYRRLSRREIPAILIDYLPNENIAVLQRVGSPPLSKQQVVTAARHGALFPAKTSRHIWVPTGEPLSQALSNTGLYKETLLEESPLLQTSHLRDIVT